MRLIDAEDVKKRADCYPPQIRSVVANILRHTKTVKPEQKRGKWIVHPEIKNVYGGTYIECSQCGEKYVVQHMEDEKYCRNCGTKMEVYNGSNT